MAALVTYAQVKNHLKLTDDNEKAVLQLLMEQATQLVLLRLERDAADSPAWDDATDPTTDAEFSLAQAAILIEVADLWRRRGDDADTPLEDRDRGRLSPRAERIASILRGPTVA